MHQTNTITRTDDPAILAGDELAEARALLSHVARIQHEVSEIAAALVDVTSHAATLAGSRGFHAEDTRAEGLGTLRAGTIQAATRILEACPTLVDSATSLLKYTRP